MSSNSIRMVAIFLVLTALILVVVAYRVSHSFASHSTQSATPVAQAPMKAMVIVAKKPLPANQPVKREDLTVIPSDVAPAEYFSSADDVVGKTPLLDVDTGTPITPRLFKEGNALAKSIPVGSQAISLKITDVIGVGSFVQPGDHVDVLVYIRADQNTHVDEQARILLPDALVLSFDDKIVASPKGLHKDASNAQQPVYQHDRTAVIAVPMDQTTRVMLGASMGELRLALRRELPAGQSAVAAAAPVVEKATGTRQAADQPFSLTQLGRMNVAAAPVARPAPIRAKKVDSEEFQVIRGCKCSEGRS